MLILLFCSIIRSVIKYAGGVKREKAQAGRAVTGGVHLSRLRQTSGLGSAGSYAQLPGVRQMGK